MNLIPHLLITEYSNPKTLTDQILNNRVIPLDTKMPTCRFRGTIVYPATVLEPITIIGWQRNFTRIQKMDASLPTIVTITLQHIDDGEYCVKQCSLDPSFKGSKGILCSALYLNRTMQHALTGARFDRTLMKTIKLQHMHCFHLVEVIGGMISFFEIIQNELNGTDPQPVYYEEENIDYIAGVNNTSFACGVHTMSQRSKIHYVLNMNNLFESISFSNNGILQGKQPIPLSFSINDTTVLEQTCSLSSNGTISTSFQRMLLSCVKHIKTAFGCSEDLIFRCSNCYPAAFMGLLVQMLAIRHFSNNYRYVMHAVTGLQRHDNKPLCVGASLDRNELHTYYPDFKQQDLI